MRPSGCRPNTRTNSNRSSSTEKQRGVYCAHFCDTVEQFEACLFAAELTQQEEEDAAGDDEDGGEAELGGRGGEERPRHVAPLPAPPLVAVADEFSCRVVCKRQKSLGTGYVRLISCSFF